MTASDHRRHPERKTAAAEAHVEPVTLVIGWGKRRLSLRLRWLEGDARKGRRFATKITIFASGFIYLSLGLRAIIAAIRFGWPDMTDWPQVATPLLSMPLFIYGALFPVGWIVDLTMPWRDQFRGYVARCALGAAASFFPGFVVLCFFEPTWPPVWFFIALLLGLLLVGGLFGTLVWFLDKTRHQTRSHDL